jgi:hypothetical protein
MPEQDAGGGGAKPDLASEFKRQPVVEKILVLAAVAFLLAFIIDNRWKTLFRFGGVLSEMYAPWKHTLSFVGAIVVLGLFVTKLMGIRLVSDRLYGRLLVAAAILPAIGLLLEELRNGWGFVMLASIVLMAYAGAKITTRDQILR